MTGGLRKARGLADLGAAGEAALADYHREGRRADRSAATLRTREAALRLLGAFLAPTPVLEATERQLEYWGDDLVARGLAVASRRTYLVSVRGFYSCAARRGLIECDPTLDLRPPSVRPGRPRPIPEADLRLALMTAARPLRTWLVLAAFCGLRAGEIARLRREHVLDSERPPLLVVDRGKGGRSRGVPLSAAVLGELAPHLHGARGRLWLADSRRAEHQVTVQVGAHLRSLGLPFTAHSLRHRFATRVYQASRDLRMTQDLLGHASVATTQIYAAWDPGRGVEVLDELGGSLCAAPGVLVGLADDESAVTTASNHKATPTSGEPQ